MLKAEIKEYVLDFAFIAKTSRETFTRKKTFLIELSDSVNPARKGVGEIAFFPSLQPSFVSENHLKQQLDEICRNIDEYIADINALPLNSSLRFGIETALANLNHPATGLSDDKGISRLKTAGIRINGLVWMNDIETMLRQINDKIETGFSCIKLKIGSLRFEDELRMLECIRNNFPGKSLQIRVDANGAFSRSEVMDRLERLSRYDIHSIEQPLPRDSEYMQEICRSSPIPVALDEDMIERWFTVEQKSEWLSKIRPSYIVLKPSLAGGFREADEWIEAAKNNGIDWWATSALESNIGLKAIAQWVSRYEESGSIPQGLGTGQIYSNNFESDLYLNGERLYLRQ